MDATPETTFTVRAAPLLAGVGTFLLSAAAISFVGARWDRFGPGDRFGALLMASAVVFAATAGLRRVAPATTRSLDVLMAALFPVDVAALTIVTGAGWPAVLFAAGPAAMISAEALRRRDPAAPAEIGTIVGGVLALGGVAASYDLAVAPLAAGVGFLACVAAPWNRERLAGPAWAALAGLAPAALVLDDAAFTGSGTLRDIGLLDVTPWWSTLLAGAVATTALAIAAGIRRSLVPALLAAASAGATAAAMWVEHRPPQSSLILAAAILVVFAEIALASGVLARFEQVRDRLAEPIAAASIALSLVVASMAADVMLEGTTYGVEWALAAASLALAWVFADLRRSWPAGPRGVALLTVGAGWAPSTWGATAMATAAVALAGAPQAAALVLLSLGLLALASGRAGAILLGWCAVLLGPLWLATEWRLGLAAALLGTTVTTLISFRSRPCTGTAGARQALVGLAIPLGAGASAVSVESAPWAFALIVTLLWMSSLAVDIPDPRAATVMRSVALVTAVVAVSVAPGLAVLLLAGTGAALLAQSAATRQGSSVVLGLWSLFVALFVGVADIATDPMVVAALALASAGVMLIGLSLDLSDRGVAVGGGFVVWYASLIGLGGAGVDIIEPYTYPILGALAAAMWRDERASTRWYAIGLPAVLAGAIAFVQRIESGDAGHTVFFGVVMLAVAVAGALRDHKPTLVVGAAATVAIGSYESLHAVVGIESWSWLVISGCAALTVAALLEATDSADAMASPDV